MNPARSCPVCTKCGSKKFIRLESNKTKVQCVNCKKIIDIYEMENPPDYNLNCSTCKFVVSLKKEKYI